MRDIPASEAGATLTIDLGALAGNWRLLDARAQAGGARAAAVVKADAYGIGIERAVPALGAAGCGTFFVAHLSEGRRARDAAPEADIYVLNGLLPGSAPAYAEARLRPVLGSRAELEEWAEFRGAMPSAEPAALHVDTGMNRLGLTVAEALALATEQSELPGRAGLGLLMTHLVSAEVPEDPVNAGQFAAFRELRAAFPALPASILNSSAHFLPDAEPGALTRPGYALYGGNPTPGRPNPMAPVVALTAPILQLREVPAGAPAGYNGTWVARRPSLLATVSVGYADGWLRSQSNTDARIAAGSEGGFARVGGVDCPLAGRVSMDLLIFDVTDAPAGAVGRGRPVTLLGDGITVDDVGLRAGTNGYEILTSLGRRYHRRYVGG